MDNVRKRIEDESADCYWIVSDEFEIFLKEHFAEMLDGKSFVVYFEGKAKDVYMTNDLQICLKNHKEEAL